MEALRIYNPRPDLDLNSISPEPTEADQKIYDGLVSVDLTPSQLSRIETPPEVYPKQSDVIAVHWHPEFVPMDAIVRRIDATFPNKKRDLIIPTQHNVLMSLGDYSGVEIDCFSAGFNRKVQLLAHFSTKKVERADVLRAMLAHTFKYRLSQLSEFIDTVLDPAHQDRLTTAAIKTGADDELIQFVRLHVQKLKTLIEINESRTRPDMLKNKLIRNYFEMLRDRFDDRLIDHAKVFLQTVKKIVKRHFTLRYFYKTEEIIEEVRGLGGGLVIPHPEQFWPILLADYDVDGIEVWNPQSREYTEFLIHSTHNQNKARRSSRRPLLIFMGDDTHFGEKVLEPKHQDPDKAARELGVQPAWDDLSIRKALIVAHADRKNVIESYRSRLD